MKQKLFQSNPRRFSISVLNQNRDRSSVEGATAPLSEATMRRVDEHRVSDPQSRFTMRNNTRFLVIVASFMQILGLAAGFHIRIVDDESNAWVLHSRAGWDHVLRTFLPCCWNLYSSWTDGRFEIQMCLCWNIGMFMLCVYMHSLCYVCICIVYVMCVYAYVCICICVYNVNIIWHSACRNWAHKNWALTSDLFQSIQENRILAKTMKEETWK